MGKSECLRVAAINVNGCQEENKRREIVDEFSKSGIDVLGVSETHLRGQGVWNSGSGNGSELWSGLKGGCVWAGRNMNEKGRGKEGCAIMMSERVWNGVTESGNFGPRGVWVKAKIGIVKYAWICVYAPVNGNTKGDKKEMNEFWMKLNACL